MKIPHKAFISVFAAFFTTGLVETLISGLGWQISSVVAGENFTRILVFSGILLLSLTSVFFSMIISRSGHIRNFSASLLMILSGLLISLSGIKALYAIMLADLLLFAGSLFVQIACLQFMISFDKTADKTVWIALSYLFKSLGMASGLFIPALLPADKPADNTLLLVLSLVALAFSFICLFIISFPAKQEHAEVKNYLVPFRALMSDKLVHLMLGGLIVYSGAEFCMGDLFPFYFSETFGITIMQTVLPGMGLFVLFFFIGRLAGTFAIVLIKPGKLFLMGSILSIIGLFAIFIGQKYLSLGAVVLTGLGASCIFPMMLILSLDMIKGNKDLLIGLMIGTIPLGALFPSLMWAVANSVSITMSFTIPVFCMFYISWIAIMLVKREALNVD